MFKLYLIRLRGHLELAASIILLMTCVYTCIESSYAMCEITSCANQTGFSMMTMFPRTVAVGCMISKMTNMYKHIRAFSVYEKKIGRYEFYFRSHRSRYSNNCRRVFTAVIVSLCVVIILPINAFRLYLFYSQYKNYRVITMFAMMYLQNASICVIELQFIARCYGLYQKFQSINEGMCVLKTKSIDTNRYPLVLKPELRDNPDNMGPVFDDDNEFCPKTVDLSLASRIELLRTRHKYVSDLIGDLNDLYSIQLGLSLSVLFIMSLLDIYEVLYTQVVITKSSLILLYGWLLQYAFRFCIIVLTTHATTKQAQKSKTLITDINYRYIDINAEEELRMFLNELSSRSMEFTTFDLFILNTRIITSALVAGTTYLVILSKFR